MDEHFILVSHVVTRWNTLTPLLVRMAVELEELGFEYSDDENVYVKEETQ